jgi:hypothetical protein
VILECAQGKSNLEVAKELGVCQHMVGKWRRRFIEQSLEGLVDAPRSGAPREISDEKVEEVVTKTLETTPAARTPTGSSWINQVERWFAKITTQAIRRGNFRSVKHLIQAIDDYIAQHNQDPKPFQWTATPESIFANLEASLT